VTVTDSDADATELAARRRQGEVSAAELVEASIRRIEAHDEAVGAVTHARFDAALAEAGAVDARGSSRYDAPFSGVPILLKDIGMGMAGEPDHRGSRLLRDLDWRATGDAWVVTRLREAGFVVLGRTAVPEFGLSCTSESLAHGPTANPWDWTRVAGGSSGGAAAAVAAGYVSVALGGDGGGSIRMPAAYCGVFGLKPSQGRVSPGPTEIQPRENHSVQGPLTRSVRDAVSLLRIVEGRLPGELAEGRLWPLPEAPPPPGVMPALRVAVVPFAELPPEFGHEANVAAVDRVADALSDHGCDVVHASPPNYYDDEYFEAFVDTLAPTVELARVRLGDAAGRTIDDEEFEQITRYWMRRGRTLSAVAHVTARTRLRQFVAAREAWWADIDVLLSPVVPYPAPRLGWFHESEGVERSLRHIRMNPQANSSGQPAFALPVGFHDGRPVGVQLVAAVGREDHLFDAALALERSGVTTAGTAPLDELDDRRL
jgi:amidase